MATGLTFGISFKVLLITVCLEQEKDQIYFLRKHTLTTDLGMTVLGIYGRRWRTIL